MTQAQKLQKKLTKGQLIAVTNRMDWTGSSGTYEGFENGRIVLRTAKGNIHTYNVENGLWHVRHNYASLI